MISKIISLERRYVNIWVMTNQELIKLAESVLSRHSEGDRLFSDVGSALVTDQGKVYKGI